MKAKEVEKINQEEETQEAVDNLILQQQQQDAQSSDVNLSQSELIKGETFIVKQLFDVDHVMQTMFLQDVEETEKSNAISQYECELTGNFSN